MRDLQRGSRAAVQDIDELIERQGVLGAAAGVEDLALGFVDIEDGHFIEVEQVVHVKHVAHLIAVAEHRQRLLELGAIANQAAQP